MEARRPLRLCAAACLILALTACNQDQQPHQDSAANADPTLVQPDANLVKLLKVAPVATAPVSEILRVAGRIDFDEQHLARIGATVTGRVTDIRAIVGQTVNKGEPLAQLHSNELSTAQLAYLKARSQQELHRRNVERADALYKADVIGAAEKQRRDSELEIASAETRAARDQLRVLGVGDASIERLGKNGTIDSVASVVSSIKGVVVERKITASQVVQPTDVLFVVADLSRVWAVAQVPEQQVNQVKEGQAVHIELPALGNEKRVGKLIYVGQTIDPDTRTVLVRTELDNPDGRLKPAMLASMLIESAPKDRLVVPASAVVRENDEDHVFVALGEGRFRLVKVQLGPEQEGRRVVQSGLKGGESIVTEGAFHLNNERNRKELEGA